MTTASRCACSAGRARPWPPSPATPSRSRAPSICTRRSRGSSSTPACAPCASGCRRRRRRTSTSMARKSPPAHWPGRSWTIAFRGRAERCVPMSAEAQLPVPRGAEEPAPFTAEVPVIEPVGVQRVSGTWAVEANTDTEIAITAPDLNEQDALSAPVVAGYQPRHRVIGVFSWLGPRYSLGLVGMRHAGAAVLSSVVDLLELESVAATAGQCPHAGDPAPSHRGPPVSGGNAPAALANCCRCWSRVKPVKPVRRKSGRSADRAAGWREFRRCDCRQSAFRDGHRW